MRTAPWLMALLIATVSPMAADEKLDELVKREQADVDNEAVTVYGGSIDQAACVFFIEWSGVGSQIDGHYYEVKRGRKTLWRLRGANPKDGVLELTAFESRADGNLERIAEIRMTKKIAKGRVVWSGEVKRLDGTEGKIEMSRPL